MLTLKQINEISFRKSSFSGYKPEDVDDFIDEVGETFTAILKENQALKAKATDLANKNTDLRDKLTVLAQKIESYRDDEDGIKNALLSAQKLGAASIKEAKNKAETIIADANSKADEMIADAKKKTVDVVSGFDKKIENKEKEFDAIKASVTSFRSSLYEMYKNHLNAIQSIPDFSEELAAKEEPKVEDYPAETTEPDNTPTEEVNDTPETQDNVNTETAVDIDSDDSVSVDDIDATESVDDTEQADENVTSENEEIEDYIPDAVYDDVASFSEEELKEDNVGGIDLNAYADIPESLRKEKESLYSTLEFGDDVNLKK